MGAFKITENSMKGTKVICASNGGKKETVLKCAGATQRCQADTAYIKAKDDDRY